MNREPTNKDDLLAENMEDAFLQLMLQKYMEQEGDDLLGLEKTLPECAPTEAQQKRLEEDLLRCFEQTHPPIKKKQSKRLMPLLVAAIAILVASLATAEAQKAHILKFLHISDDVSTQYGIADSESRGYTLQYIPKDYVELKYDVYDDSSTVIYVNRKDDSHFFRFSIYPSSQRINIDTENAEYIEDIQISFMQGEISCKESLSSLVWVDPEIQKMFVLQTTLERAEAIRIAENVQLN